MNSNFKQIRIAEISDIHLGHRRNKTEDIIENLNTYFCNSSFLSTVDFVILAGDVFDDILSYSNDAIPAIQSWISRFLTLCSNLDIVVRILEGTPSHDRKQSKNFMVIDEIRKSQGSKVLDVKYMDTVCIEHINKFGINVLYVPDEINHDNEDTLIAVKELLKSKNLNSVDIGVMHGCFEYQIPEITKNNIKHNSEEYLKIVSGLIFIGHVHKFSNYKRIYASGSFDRLKHGEEEAKGFISAVLYNDNSSEIKFIENKTAKKFITIKSTSPDMEHNLKRIEKRVLKLPADSYISIETNHNNPMITALDTLKRRWPLLNWSILKGKEETKNIELVKEVKYTPIIINKDTLRALVMNKINKLHLKPNVLDKCLMHLTEMEKL